MGFFVYEATSRAISVLVDEYSTTQIDTHAGQERLSRLVADI